MLNQHMNLPVVTPSLHLIIHLLCHFLLGLFLGGHDNLSCC